MADPAKGEIDSVHTPGIIISGTRAPNACRVKDCEEICIERLCDEHYLQLQACKVKSLPCRPNSKNPNDTNIKYAYFEQMPASETEPAWSGIRLRNQAAENAANK